MATNPRLSRVRPAGIASGGGVLLIGAALLACAGSKSSSPPRVLVGTVANSDARVGVVATEGRARLFFCGGPSSYSTSTHWFSVDLDADGNVVPGSGTAGPYSVVGRVSGGAASGSVTTADGQTLTFAATAVGTSPVAGVYEANGACGKVGLIVSDSATDSTPIGQGACIAAATPGVAVSKVLQVNPLLPLVRAADGSIRVTVNETMDEVSVLPAAAP